MSCFKKKYMYHEKGNNPFSKLMLCVYEKNGFIKLCFKDDHLSLRLIDSQNKWETLNRKEKFLLSFMEPELKISNKFIKEIQCSSKTDELKILQNEKTLKFDLMKGNCAHYNQIGGLKDE